MSFLPAAPFSFRQQKREVASRCSLLLSVVTLFVCGPLAATEPSAANSPPSGFVALFNGQDLSGWQGLVQTPAERAALSPEKLAAAQQLADESMREHWRVEDGVLAFDGAGHNLCTVRDYENFELYVDWKIVPDGISGIYLRGAPQVQICDPARSAKNRVGSGGLFNNKQHPDEPLVTADNPVGQWNTFYILMIGERVTVTLNGKLVVDDVVLENYWDRGKPIYATGPIELQSHGNPVYFRNIFLRELPHHPSPSWENLFDGTDLDRWDYRRRGWRIEDGALVVSDRYRDRGETDNFIWSKERFGDFILDLEFKTAPRCNSGVFIRTDDRVEWLHTGIEIQILDSFDREEIGTHDCGAIYDIMAPRANAVRPPGEWNRMTVVAQDNLISVVLNDQRVIDLDLNQWTEAHRNPDGTDNKFNTAYRDLKREGFIGFQDHGTPISFRNVRIKRLR